MTFEFLRQTKELYGSECNVSAKLVDANMDMLRVAVERADALEDEFNGEQVVQFISPYDFPLFPFHS